MLDRCACFFLPLPLRPLRTMDGTAGFKFIGNTALRFVKEGLEVPFGYEEAIRYVFGSEIRDKYGVSVSVSEP